jgi:hypothetical protein
MSLYSRAVPTSPTNELHNAFASSFGTKQWVGTSARPNRQTVAHDIQSFESGLVARLFRALDTILNSKISHLWWVLDRLGMQPLSTAQEAGLWSCLRARTSPIAYSGPKHAPPGMMKGLVVEQS